jgi:hypothetical protein
MAEERGGERERAPDSGKAFPVAGSREERPSPSEASAVGGKGLSDVAEAAPGRRSAAARPRFCRFPLCVHRRA